MWLLDRLLAEDPERAGDGTGNRVEQIERAAFVVGSHNRSASTQGFQTFKDLAFEEKFWDVVGLYLNPPDRALLLCCDEKSQCQALERSQPGLP